MSAAAKAPDFMIPAKQLPRAIAFSPRFVDPLSGSIFHCDKGPRLNRPCPVPHYSTNTCPSSNRKIPVSCKLLGHCGRFAPTQPLLLNRLADQAFFAPWRCFYPAKFYLNGGPIRPQPRLPQSKLAIGPDSGDREEGTAEARGPCTGTPPRRRRPRPRRRRPRRGQAP